MNWRVPNAEVPNADTQPQAKRDIHPCWSTQFFWPARMGFLIPIACFYLTAPSPRQRRWRPVEHVGHELFQRSYQRRHEQQVRIELAAHANVG